MNINLCPSASGVIGHSHVVPIAVDLRFLLLDQVDVTFRALNVIGQHPVKDIPQLHPVDLRVDVQNLIPVRSMEDELALIAVVIPGDRGLDLLVNV